MIVDDGVATGATVIAAAIYLKRSKARELILATPVISSDIIVNIKKYFDTVIQLRSVGNFYAVGQFYKHFEQISDEEVTRILNI